MPSEGGSAPHGQACVCKHLDLLWTDGPETGDHRTGAAAGLLTTCPLIASGFCTGMCVYSTCLKLFFNWLCDPGRITLASLPHFAHV